VLPVLLPATVVGVLLAEIDRRCLRLPDPLVGVLAVLVVVPLRVADRGRVGGALVGAGLYALAYAMVWLVSRGQLGLGDVKLAAVLGFPLGFLGWPALLIGALAPHLINGPVAVFRLVTGRAGRSTALPFGPALLLGALVAVTAT
jgi:leader peptidase (prepilin peptidase)/N-methyltransferase